jgi:hypothetical protein
MTVIDDQCKGKLETWEAVREFMFGGAARFTLVSIKTGTRFTYKVQVKRADVKAGSADPIYFVSLLRGPDNEGDYAYMGVLRKPGMFRCTEASRVSRTAPAVMALAWALDMMRCSREALGVTLEIWHEGRCCSCGRALTVPKSIADGYGPECAKYFAGRAA